MTLGNRESCRCRSWGFEAARASPDLPCDLIQSTVRHGTIVSQCTVQTARVPRAPTSPGISIYFHSNSLCTQTQNAIYCLPIYEYPFPLIYIFE